ncbi:MAG TPA: glycosyl transferase [Candidatus Rifleibacterium sp.]|nr:glycosyl transferase [Candidatus Rifleibacterium sp.]
MYNYCTLFDSSFFTRGLAMYESLSACCQNFHLYIFAFDDRCYALLKEMALDSVTVISLKDFEDEKLLKIKGTRTAGEYCWTCTPSVIRFAIQYFNLDHCTYLDADLYFYSDPSRLVDELGEKSVLITEHRYTPKYDQSKISGVYCVQFMTFRNNSKGMEVLEWWRNACLDWCYAKVEGGKFGDQKYLDDWLERFDSVHVLQNPGGGVAPWNIQQFDILKRRKELVFFHFHKLKFTDSGLVDFGTYLLQKHEVAQLYVPYVRHLEMIRKKVALMGEDYDYNGSVKADKGFVALLKAIKRRLLGVYNVFCKSELLGE